jgi:hypothetical protein
LETFFLAVEKRPRRTQNFREKQTFHDLFRPTRSATDNSKKRRSRHPWASPLTTGDGERAGGVGPRDRSI